uniref:R3H-associated N-terminal domain-containing protein n=1 Tax=Strigamia maritima TaxID=126957 RepID=T1IKV4_STRMM
MGVIINTPDPFGDEIIENILDNLIQENIDDNYSPRIKQRKCKNRAPVKPMDAATSRAGQIGNRRNRRNENANFLTTLAGNQDFGEVSIYDFVPKTISAFAQVLKDNSSVWNNIINCSEEDEEVYLRQIHERCSSDNSGNDKTQDERQIYPAFDAELCFERIESKFKSMFKKRHFPLGSLAFLEDQITSFFLECPRSVYTSLLPNAFDRLMLHALCQYLDLHSESFTRRGARHTEVKNLRDDFSLPTSSLTSFLENRNGIIPH